MVSHPMNRLVLSLLGVTLLTGCPPQKPEDTTRDVARANAKDESEPVATIEGQPITLHDFNRRIEGLAPEARMRFGSVEARKSFLEAQIQFEVLANRAERKGYGNSPQTLDAMKEALANELMDEAVRAEVTASSIDATAIKAYYDAHLADYRTPRTRAAVAIFTDFERDAQRLRDALENLQYERDEQRVYTFRTFADRNAIFVEQRNQGGSIGDLVDPEVGDESEYAALAPAVFALSKPGEMTPVMPWKKYYVFATYTGERPAGTQDLATVEAEIRDTLYQQARKEARERFAAKVMAKAKVEPNNEVLDAIEQPKAEQPPAAPIVDALGAALGYDIDDP